LKKSIEYFEQAIEKDPTYAPAYVGLADAYIQTGFYGVLPPNVAYPSAKAAALKALEMDNTLGEAHASLALFRQHYEHDWPSAENEFKLALDRSPGYASAHQWYGLYLAAVGRLEEGLAETKKAYELDPLSSILNENIGWQYYLAREYEKAIEQYRKTLDLDPNFAEAHYSLGLSLERLGRYEESVAELQKAVSLSGGNERYLGALGHAFAVAGRQRAALRVLEQLQKLAEKTYVRPYDIALIHMGLGQKDQGFAWLEKAYEEGPDTLRWLKVDPEFDPLRSDPRFRDLLRRLHFPP
jgi:tetratricopeptide (TPR) repeat protein